MVSVHQRLLRTLVDRFVEMGIRITYIDVGDTPGLFPEYPDLEKPPPMDGKIPDLRGVDENHVIHIGEAETSASGSNTEEQLRAFSCEFTPHNIPIPLYVIVPSGDKAAMEHTIRGIGLGSKIGNRIHVWEG